MQQRNHGSNNEALKAKLTAILARQNQSSDKRDDDVGLLYDTVKDFALYIRNTEDFDEAIANLLKQADELLSLTLRMNLLIHLAHTYKSEDTDKFIIKFLRAYPEVLDKDFTGILSIINTYIKLETTWIGISGYREKAITLLAEMISLAPQKLEKRLAIIEEFLSEGTSEEDAVRILNSALLQCIKTASDNHDLAEIKSLIELGKACDIEISDKYVVEELVYELQSSINDHNSRQIIATLTELQSVRYQQYFNINAAIDGTSATLLSIAIDNGNYKAIRYLLDAGARNLRLDINKLNNAFITAIRKSENQLMDQLLELGADPHHRIGDTGISTLHVAAMYGNVDAIKKLLAMNLSSLNCDAHGDTPLTIAVKRNDVEAVRVFIDAILNKSHPADRLLKFLKFNRQLEYLLTCANSPEVMDEVCRLIAYLDSRGVAHDEIRTLVNNRITTVSVQPFMANHETESYYAKLKEHDLTNHHDFLQGYYRDRSKESALTLALESQHLNTVKMLLLIMKPHLNIADCEKFKGRHQLLAQLDKDYPIIVNTLLTLEFERIGHYVQNNDLNGINRIYDLVMINPEERNAELVKYNKVNHQFRNAILAAKDGNMCLALLRFIDLLEKNGHIDLHDLLPEKYTFANYHLKEDIFAAIKALPLAERIKKYNAILNDKDSAYYHIFHMKRGYIWGVNEKRGILHEVREAYNNDMTLNSRLYQATKTNDLPAMRACIQQGADVNYQDTTQIVSYPIQVASYLGFTEAVRLLIENGANLNVEAVNLDGGLSALSFAAGRERKEVVDLLLSKNANTDLARTIDNSTALMLAISNVNLPIVQSLLDHHAKIDTFGNASIEFESPLVLATRAGSEEILNTLVHHLIEHYDIQRIVTFLQAHDNLKTCFNRAGTNVDLLTPLQKLLKHLVANNVPSDVFEALLPESMKTMEKKVEAAPASSLYPKLTPESTGTPEKQAASASLYPQIKQESVQHPDIMQQYLNKGRQLRTEAAPPLYIVENPFTDKPLPQAPVAPVNDPFAAIDTILQAPAAPKQPSWMEGLNEIDFSGSSTAVMMSKLADLISFEEPAKTYVNPFDELIEKEKQATAAKPGYINPFDELLEKEREEKVAAQLDALPKAPTGHGLFTASNQEKSRPTEYNKKMMVAN